MQKRIYKTPTVALLTIEVEAGIAYSVNGFEADSTGTVIGSDNDAGNGYGNFNNGSY